MRWKADLEWWREQWALLRLGVPTGLQLLSEVGAFSAAGLLIGHLGAVPLAAHPVAAVAALALGTCGLLSALPLCWSLATAFLGGAAAASGIALINSFGNLSGFVAPYAVGFIREQTGATDYGVYALAVSLLVGAALVLWRVPASLVNR